MKNNKKTFATVVAFIFSIVFSTLFKWIQTGNPFRLETVAFGTIIFLLTFINGYVGYTILGKTLGKSITEIKRKIIPSFLIFTVLTLIISVVVISVVNYIFYVVQGINTSDYIANLFRVGMISATKQFGVWILIASSFFFYMIWRETIEREQKLREENLTYRYQNLKRQINPHFLFNTLNTLSELVYIDAKQSDSFIQDLSSIYRYILENEEVRLVDLGKELTFVRQYLNLQLVRDSKKLEINFNVPDRPMRIVPVSLQSLVENAIKHNTKSKENPLVIKIEYNSGYISVSNTIQKKNILEKSTNTGLNNLKTRIKFITQKELLINSDDTTFTVKIPVVE